jgi:hypothetical protein
MKNKAPLGTGERRMSGAEMTASSSPAPARLPERRQIEELIDPHGNDLHA